MKEYIKYAPLGLLSLFALKALILSVGLPELGVIAVLGAFAAYYEKSYNDSFQKETLEKLETHRKGFENVDSYIKQLLENDKGMLIQIQKLQLPASVKNNGFGNLRG